MRILRNAYSYRCVSYATRLQSSAHLHAVTYTVVTKERIELMQGIILGINRPRFVAHVRLSSRTITISTFDSDHCTFSILLLLFPPQHKAVIFFITALDVRGGNLTTGGAVGLLNAFLTGAPIV